MRCALDQFRIDAARFRVRVDAEFAVWRFCAASARIWPTHVTFAVRSLGSAHDACGGPLARHVGAARPRLGSSPNFTIASVPIKMLAQSYLGAVLKIPVSAYFTRSALNFLGEGE